MAAKQQHSWSSASRRTENHAKHCQRVYHLRTVGVADHTTRSGLLRHDIQFSCDYLSELTELRASSFRLIAAPTAHQNQVCTFATFAVSPFLFLLHLTSSTPAQSSPSPSYTSPIPPHPTHSPHPPQPPSTAPPPPPHSPHFQTPFPHSAHSHYTTAEPHAAC